MIPPSPPPTVQPNYTVPETIIIDWRCKVKGPVVQQGNCGSCYAIAALDSIHLSITMRRNLNFTFSVQEVISCGHNDVSVIGCNGGYFDGVFEYAETRGVGSSELYPLSD